MSRYRTEAMPRGPNQPIKLTDALSSLEPIRQRATGTILITGQTHEGIEKSPDVPVLKCNRYKNQAKHEKNETRS
jgi:hypothetical protein